MTWSIDYPATLKAITRPAALPPARGYLGTELNRLLVSRQRFRGRYAEMTLNHYLVPFADVETHLRHLGAGNHADNVASLRPFPRFYRTILLRR